VLISVQSCPVVEGKAAIMGPSLGHQSRHLSQRFQAVMARSNGR